MASSAKLPAKMTAIAISEPGGPMVLKPERRDLPEPGEGEVLIEVRAAGVNRPDVQQRLGAYPPPPGASDLPGLEVSGVVAALGETWPAGSWATRSARSPPAAATQNMCVCTAVTPCLCRLATLSPRPRHSLRPSSLSGTMSSSAAH